MTKYFTILCQDNTTFSECIVMIKWYLETKCHFKGEIRIQSSLNENEIDENSQTDGIYLIFALHNFQGQLPKRYIAYQLEQLQDRNIGHLDQIYLNKLRQADEVWEYSYTNYRTLTRDYNLNNVYLVPLGHCPPLFKGLDFSQSKTGEEFVFMGGINNRRVNILDSLEKSGVNIRRHSNVWGDERDNVTYNAVAVLNIHYFTPSILETTRLIYLLCNGCLVVSERSGDPVLDGLYEPYIYLVQDVNEMTDKCLELAKFSDSERVKLSWERIYGYRNNSKLEFNLSNSKIVQSLKSDPGESSNSNIKSSKMATSSNFDMIDMQTNNETGRLVYPHVKVYNWENMPQVSLVTPFYADKNTYRDKLKLFEMVLRSFEKFKYPQDAMEWTILDDSPHPWLESILPLDTRIKYHYIGDNGKLPISVKRNRLVELSTHNYIIHLDADDFYYSDTVWNRVSILKSYRNMGRRCIGCHIFPVYDLETGGCVIFETVHMSEASMAYTRDFWIDRPFADRDTTQGESPPFLQGRKKEVLSIPFNLNFVPITHICNATGKLRKVHQEDSTLSTGELFNQYDQDYLISLYRKIYK